MDRDQEPKQPRDILVPKEHVRKINPEDVEIVGEEGASASSGPRSAPHSMFEGTPFQMKNIKVISGGPWVFLLPILIPLFLLLMLILIVPLMLFGRFFFRRAR